MKQIAIAAAAMWAMLATAVALDVPPAKGKCQTIQARCALFAHGETSAVSPNPWQPLMFGCNPATGRWSVSQQQDSAWQACMHQALAGKKRL